ncbi:hypothetical protein GCM10011584_18370 [Nocardioides phosphati]|uniref:DUF1906 domain-containing protein n=1 Tax=Nocardioides phosphati TaxID=1867775 RepID=A0ABQ2NAV1_9ACTN|nr:hypothetical protein [Nocardioides phosphati]GGO89293.1 hypothetical protein GCM10011584_18370 [Nocardioides phosphati]
MPLRLAACVLTLAALVGGCGGGTPAASPPGGSGTTPAAPTGSPSGSVVGAPSQPAIQIPKGLDEAIAKANSHAPTHVSDGPDRRVLGADASWPQCPEGMGIPQKRSKGAPLPTAAARFVVLGLTNGPSFTPNPCLADQVAWARSRSLLVSAYAVVSWPAPATLAQVKDAGPYDGSTRLGALHNAGYAAAAYSLKTMRTAGLDVPGVWIDVEPVPDFDWSGNTGENAAVVEGTARGYRDAGLQIGYYSVPSLWKRVVGTWRTGGAPEWRAAGETSMATALARCAADWSFGGGQAVLTQWIEDQRDRDVTCPGQGGRLGRWFTRVQP